MPIQATINQQNGTVATYHVITDVRVNVAAANVPGSSNAHFDSWLDKAHKDDGSLPMNGFNVDITPLLAQPPANNLPTVGQQTIDAIEKYVLTTDDFSGATQVA